MSGYVWNVGQTRKIKLSTIKEFIIQGYGNDWQAVAQISGTDFAVVSKGDTKEKVQKFIDDLTNKD